MTGRDLIIYILENNLENEPIFKDGKCPGCITISEAALKFSVGEETIRAWYMLEMLDGYMYDGKLYIFSDSLPLPKGVTNNE